MNPEVSVIIPTYKGSETLKRAIDSVLGQNGFDRFEIIVVDDNPPESRERKETETVMEQYRDNAEIQYVQHIRNLNGAAARNTGFRHSSGELICFLDDDDVFLPEKLRLQADYMDKHPEFGASYTWRIQNCGDIVKYNKTGNLEKEILLLDFFPTTITIMIRRACFEALNGFDESFWRHQDFEFLIRFFRKFKIGVVCAPLSRIIGKGAGKQGNSLPGREFEALKKRFLETFSEEIDRIESYTPGFRRRVYANHYAEVFTAEIAGKEYALAREQLRRGLKAYGLYYLCRVAGHYWFAILRRIDGSLRAKKK